MALGLGAECLEERLHSEVVEVVGVPLIEYRPEVEVSALEQPLILDEPKTKEKLPPLSRRFRARTLNIEAISGGGLFLSAILTSQKFTLATRKVSEYLTIKYTTPQILPLSYSLLLFGAFLIIDSVAARILNSNNSMFGKYVVRPVGRHILNHLSAQISRKKYII